MPCEIVPFSASYRVVVPGGVPESVNVHWLAAPEQLRATTLVPEMPTHFCPVWMSEIVPFGFTDHCCAGPPVQVCSTILPLDMPAHRLLIIRKAPSKVNFCSADPLQAAVFSWVP